MRQRQTLFSWLGNIARLLRPSGRSELAYDSTRLYYPSPRSEEEVNGFPDQPGAGEILVVEIEQVEFVREWSRTMAEEATAHANPSSVPEIDRRLPHFDRRHAGHDRRASDGQGSRKKPV
jgi:hypothetical protein